MPEHVAPALMPLAQLNVPTTGQGGSTAAPHAETPAPAPPATGTHVEGSSTQGAGGATITGAQTSTSQSGTAVKEPPPAPASPWGGLASMLPIILIFVALYLFLFRGQKKEEKRRKAQIAEMKKGDKVQTVGGLVARVISIDNDEVVLKVDESANVRAVYKKSAILNVIVPSDDKAK